MGTNSIQAWAIVVFLLAFTCLGGAMAAGGNLLLILLFLAGGIGSAFLFMKCKPWEHREVGVGSNTVVHNKVAIERN
jgi:hypothetical protein